MHPNREGIEKRFAPELKSHRFTRILTIEKEHEKYRFIRYALCDIGGSASLFSTR
jgi:hypothetical protein